MHCDINADCFQFHYLPRSTAKCNTAEFPQLKSPAVNEFNGEVHLILRLLTDLLISFNGNRHRNHSFNFNLAPSCIYIVFYFNRQ